VERYSAEGRKDRHVVEEMAREVVGTHPDVIVLFSNVHALAFKEATTVIPIVASTADPVATGVVPSLARPGGNITGVATNAGFQMHEKWIELLRTRAKTVQHFFPCVRTQLGSNRIFWRGGPRRSKACGRFPNPHLVGIDLQ
jgi:ABC-type uncharacterized transport system substrate-binding protein